MIVTSALALVACVRGNTTDTPASDGGDGSASTSTVAPVEVEPSEGGVPLEVRRAGDAPEKIELKGVLLGLDPDDCVLIAELGSQRLEHSFEFPAACHFATDAAGRPRMVETDTGPALIVESSKPIGQDCDTALRVVVITSAGPRLSKAEQHVAMCAPSDWDELMFHVLASSPVAFGTPGAEP
ncbi:hypothetical protein [Enhygromyxa salina]|uniref:Uncharacterized protein n=1 Tax=Enhygromyxa salina TaxID=215803 RepID=A0A2S9YNS2_9BACT|nr:hypothetical protein [Enhygromyxa salina]PRQ06736.1 hypothetical protein ENSA7_36120 [Enhygromyxa salina]